MANKPGAFYRYSRNIKQTNGDHLPIHRQDFPGTKRGETGLLIRSPQKNVFEYGFSSLIAGWLFNEDRGISISDYSVYNNPITSGSFGSWTGSGLFYDGVTNWTTAQYENQYEAFGNNFSVVAWLNISSSQNANCDAFGTETGITSDKGWTYRPNSNVIYLNDGNILYSASVSHTSDTVQFVGFSVDKDNLVLKSFLNGKKEQTVILSQSYSGVNNFKDMGVGWTYNLSRAFTGTIYSLCIYNTTLTENQFETLYSIGRDQYPEFLYYDTDTIDKTKGSAICTWQPNYNSYQINQAKNILFALNGDLDNRYELGWSGRCCLPSTIGLYSFTSEHDSIIYDFSVYKNNLSVNTGDIHYIDSSFGQAISGSISGSQSASILTNFSDLTYECILFPVSESNSYIAHDDQNNWYVKVDSLGRISAYMSMSQGDIILKGNTTIVDDWHHIALLYDNSTKRGSIYVDGDINDTAIGSGSRINTTTNIIPIDTSFNGYIAATRMSDTILRPSDFMQHFYFRSLSNKKQSSSGSVYFDAIANSFTKKQTIDIGVKWSTDESSRFANIYIKGKKGITDNGWNALSKDINQISVGCLPVIDKHTLGMWLFDGTTASSGSHPGFLRDWSNYDNHATIYSLNNSDLVHTEFGRIYQIDGENDYITTPLQIKKPPFTIESLFYIRTNKNYNHISSQRNDYTGFDFQFYIDSNGNVNYVIESGTSVIWNTSLNENQWIYLSIVVDNSTVILYVNGRKYDKKNITSTWTASQTIQLGSVDTGASNKTFAGKIAFIRISDIARDTDTLFYNAQNSFSQADGIISNMGIF